VLPLDAIAYFNYLLYNVYIMSEFFPATNDEYLSTPEMTGNDPSAFEHTIIKDFYLSFLHSQGASETQKEIQRALADYHIETAGTEALSTMYRRMSTDEVEERVSRLKLPGEHEDKEAIVAETTFSGTQKYPDVIAKTFVNQWRMFCENLEPFVHSDEYSFGVPYSRQQNVTSMLRNMSLTDLEFQNRPRPHRSESSDPHKSLVREYILRGQATGSDAYDTIFGWCREALASTPELQEQLQSLASEWELTHPGESFVPQELSSPIQPVASEMSAV
jgi:hypothetical protein